MNENHMMSIASTYKAMNMPVYEANTLSRHNITLEYLLRMSDKELAEIKLIGPNRARKIRIWINLIKAITWPK